MFPVVYDEIHTDGYPSLGCVGAKRLLSWQNDKHWLTIKQGLLGLQAVADLQDASTNDFRAPCVFAVGVLPPHRPQQQGLMVTVRMRSVSDSIVSSLTSFSLLFTLIVFPSLFDVLPHPTLPHCVLLTLYTSYSKNPQRLPPPSYFRFVCLCRHQGSLQCNRLSRRTLSTLSSSDATHSRV